MSVNLLVLCNSNIGGRPPLAFYDSELRGRPANSAIPLLVRASMANTDVRRVLVDKLVDNSSGYKLLSFMDAYSGYNHIPMAEEDKQKTTFMTESGNYYFNVMPFGL